MKKLIGKLKSNNGESLAESLSAILVFTLSSILLLSMITSAAKINFSAEQFSKNLAGELFIAEAQGEAEEAQIENETICVQIEDDAAVQHINITKYSAGEGKLYSYDYVREENP